MKRKLAVLLMTALTASALLSGCGNQADGAGSTTDSAGSTTDSAADAECGGQCRGHYGSVRYGGCGGYRGCTGRRCVRRKSGIESGMRSDAPQ